MIKQSIKLSIDELRDLALKLHTMELFLRELDNKYFIESNINQINNLLQTNIKDIKSEIGHRVMIDKKWL